MKIHTIGRIFAILAFGFTSAGPALAINKCVDTTGKISYQEHACPSTTAKPSSDLAAGVANARTATAAASIPQSKLEAIVANSLKDPGSVQFRNLRHLGDGQALCGSANAKNSYGGYVGFRAFIADSEGVAWEGDGSATVDIGKLEARNTYVPKAHRWGCLYR